MKNLIILMIFLFVSSCATQNVGELKDMGPKEKKAELYYDYGTTALSKGDYTKALVNLNKAIEIIDDDSRFHNNLGMAYFFKKDTNKAIHHLKESISLDSKNSDAKNNLASVYFYQGNIEEAEKIYEEVTKDLEYSKQFRVYYNLGLIYLNKGRINKAISLFKKSVQENKSYCPAHYQLGMIAYKNHSYHEASNNFQNASLGTCNDNATPYYYEALSLYNLGEYSEALLKLEEVQEKFPKSKEAVLAVRKIKSIKVDKLRNNEKQALRYNLNKFEKEIRSKLPTVKATEAEEGKATKSVDF